MHLICTKPDGSGKFWLNDWDEETLLSLEKTYCGYKSNADYDRIFVVGMDRPVQMTLF